MSHITHDDSPSRLFAHIYTLLRTQGFKDNPVYWSIFPRSGWSTSLLLLDAAPKQADLPMRSPLSAGRKFSVVRRRGSHCVSHSPCRNRHHVSTQCFGTDTQTFDQCWGVLQDQLHVGRIPTRLFHLLSDICCNSEIRHDTGLELHELT